MAFGFLFVSFSFLLEKTETVVWNEINLVERYGMAYEKFSFPDIQKELVFSLLIFGFS